MVKRHSPPDAGETVCPACGAAIRLATSARRRRVQCPKCREVVFIESASTAAVETDSPVADAPPPATVNERRLDLLEARVEVLEAALRDAMAARAAVPPGEPQRKLVWISTTPGTPPDFSPAQAEALSHNLGGVRSQAITIRTPVGDAAARAHAEWFKLIFERAGWTVHGPEEVQPHAGAVGLSLAVPEIPVAKEAAATYLALKAAGFETTPVLDSKSAPSASALSLTLSPVQAA